MKKGTLRAILLLLVLALIGAGCGTAADNNGDDSGDNQSDGGDNVEVTQGGDMTFAVTHGDARSATASSRSTAAS
jgi:hypothetical protein